MAANRFFGINRGESQLGVVVMNASPSDTITGKGIEVAIDTTTLPNKLDILLALQHLSDFIREQPY